MKIIYIHRGRNQRSTEIGRLFTSQDYNFDYRGKNPFVLLLKAFITSTEIPKADIYFIEGGLNMNVALWLKMFKARRSKIIVMVMDPLFYFDELPKWKQRYIKHLINQADGMIAICEMIKKDARKLFKKPIVIAHRYVLNIERFNAVKANPKSRKMIYVIERPDETGHVKGMDIAIEAFKLVKKTVKDAELLIIGRGTEKLKFKTKGIKALGFKKVEDIYPECSLILAPARYDAFPYCVAEACLSEVIPIVSNTTGSREYINKVDKSLVINSLNPKDYAEKVIDVWKMDDKQRALTSQKLRQEAMKLNKNQCIKEFKSAWSKLTK